MEATKKILSVILILIFAVSSVAFADENPVTVFVDDAQIIFDVEPIIENGRTLVPMRFIFEALGADVNWISETSTVVAVKDDIEIRITINSTEMYRNGDVVMLDVPAKLTDGRTLVPVRAVSEGLNAIVDWDPDTRRVSITSADGRDDEPDNAKTEEISYNMGELSPGDKERVLHLMPSYRYYFEQKLLPDQFLNSGMDNTLAEWIDSDFSNLIDVVYGIWDEVLAPEIIEIQIESEDTYTFDGASEEDIQNAIIGLIEKNGIDGRSVFEAKYDKTPKGKSLILLTFKEPKSSDPLLITCSHIAIVSTGDSCRYFTLEPSAVASELAGKDVTMFCEIFSSESGEGVMRTSYASIPGDVKSFLTEIDNLIDG